MEKTSKKTASETLEETLQRLTLQGGPMDTFPVTLFRSKKSGQVLYLEAGKGFVDTIFSFVLLPVGTIIHRLSTGVSQEQHYGAISNIYKSIEKLDSELLHVDRNSILAQPTPGANNPSGLSKAYTATGLLHLCQDADAKRLSPPKKKLNLPQQFYKCHNCNNLSSKKGARCYNCWPENGRYKSHCNFILGPYPLSAKNVQRQNDLVAQQELVEEYNRATGLGFVKEGITFMLTDKLEIKTSTTMEIINLLKEMTVNSLADLESMKISVTITQVLQLLGSALTCNSCLNDVFGTGESGRIAGETSTSEMHDAVADVRYLFCDE